jgi:DNA-binding GntR family transcriptional regulator
VPPKQPELPRERVERVIRERISDGTYPAGSQLPPMDELAAELGVARGTVAAVLRQLAAEAPPPVRVIPGYGSFVIGEPADTALATMRSGEQFKNS